MNPEMSKREGVPWKLAGRAYQKLRRGAQAALLSQWSYRRALKRLGELSQGGSGALVSPGDRRFFEEAGYLILESGVPDAVLNSVIGETLKLYERWRPGGPHVPDRCQDAWRTSPNVKALVLRPKILAVLRELYGRIPLPFQTLNFPVGTEQPVHSDTIHFNSNPPGFLAGVWVSLEEIDEGNGPLVFYPGSHRLPEYTLADIGASPGIPSYALYEKFIAGMIAERKLSPKLATVKKGEMIIWAANLLHGGAPQKDRTRTRQSQATHYFFEGCRYYTPLLSAPAQITTRHTDWIV